MAHYLFNNETILKAILVIRCTEKLAHSYEYYFSCALLLIIYQVKHFTELLPEPFSSLIMIYSENTYTSVRFAVYCKKSDH